MIQLESPKTVKHALIISGQVDLKCIAKGALSLVFLVIIPSSMLLERLVNLRKGTFNNYVEAKSFRRFNETAFLSDLHAIPWEIVSYTNNPDLALDLFLGLLRPICEKHAPTKKIKISKANS